MVRSADPTRLGIFAAGNFSDRSLRCKTSFMKNPIVKLDTRRITDWQSFHDVFAEQFGFPDFYGRNMDAWIDCMTSLDALEHGMTSIHAHSGGVVVLQLDHVDDFAARCPELYDAVVEATSFVNWRRIDVGDIRLAAFSIQTPSGST